MDDFDRRLIAVLNGWANSNCGPCREAAGLDRDDPETWDAALQAGIDIELRMKESLSIIAIWLLEPGASGADWIAGSTFSKSSRLCSCSAEKPEVDAHTHHR